MIKKFNFDFDYKTNHECMLIGSLYYNMKTNNKFTTDNIFNKDICVSWITNEETNKTSIQVEIITDKHYTGEEFEKIKKMMLKNISRISSIKVDDATNKFHNEEDLSEYQNCKYEYIGNVLKLLVSKITDVDINHVQFLSSCVLSKFCTQITEGLQALEYIGIIDKDSKISFYNIHEYYN